MSKVMHKLIIECSIVWPEMFFMSPCYFLRETYELGVQIFVNSVLLQKIFLDHLKYNGPGVKRFIPECRID